MKLEFSRHTFEKYSNIKFHENPSIEMWHFMRDRRADIKKLTVTFRSFASAPNIHYSHSHENLKSHNNIKNFKN